MAGMIKREDIEAVRERARIDDVVCEHVTLRNAGVGSMKGLCPFHDEKTPSFHVRPHIGRWHCFGCNEGGDVISFIQRIHGIGFVEAVEHLADRVGIQLRYEEGSGPRDEKPGLRRRLIAAHEVAEAYYREQLRTPAAQAARTFLTERDFDAAVIDHFGIGFAPDSWDGLLRVLRQRGFTEEEIVASGLVTTGTRGPYDRFRGRLMWPIRDVIGSTIGFGARRLSDDDKGPKYLNTPETPIYKKSQVLYGIDLAKKGISARRQVVVVEGYTDVMAAHIAGVPTAVATCGTAFGSDHVRIVRRLLGDFRDAASGVMVGGRSQGGEVIFTFDGDAAGRKAALKAFNEDQSFGAQTFVAVEPRGLDPCDLRLQEGDEAVRSLIESRQPLFRFVMQSTLADLDLTTSEGRVAGLRSCAPIVATIRDRALRGEYIRELAGWLGMDIADVQRETNAAGRRQPARRARAGRSAPVADAGDVVERQSLQLALQYPHTCYLNGFDSLATETFHGPANQVVFDAIQTAGGTGICTDDTPGAVWLEAVLEHTQPAFAAYVNQLAMTDLPVTQAGLSQYTVEIFNALVIRYLTRAIARVKAQLSRLSPHHPDYQQTMQELYDLEAERRRRQG